MDVSYRKKDKIHSSSKTKLIYLKYVYFDFINKLMFLIFYKTFRQYSNKNQSIKLYINILNDVKIEKTYFL